MVTASDMSMHHVLITFTLTFIQSQTDINHENYKCLFQKLFKQCPSSCCEDSPTKGIYMAIGSPMTFTFIQGHKCVSNVTPF